MKRRYFILTSITALASMVWGGSYYWKNRWKYIVIHHSAGNFGNIGFLQKVHRERQRNDPIDAIPYHYIIGNGNGLNLGQVASDWRHEWDIWGAHVSSRNMDRNVRGIGICLIGNYETGEVPEKQYQALVELTKKLMIKHNIGLNNVSGHGYIPGEQTKCPGKNFPMKRFLQDIA